MSLLGGAAHIGPEEFVGIQYFSAIENFLYFISPLKSMRGEFLFMVMAIFVTGCAPARLECTTWDELHTLPNYTAFDEWVEQNPCGSLRVRSPLFNVSGQVRGSSSLLGNWVYLHITPNLTRGAARFVVGNCASLARVPINESGSFVFLSLPAGKYVAVTYSFDNNSQMVLHEYNRSGFVIRQDDEFMEGNRLYSVFSVLSNDDDVTLN